MTTQRRSILVGIVVLAGCGNKSSEPAVSSGSAPLGKAAIAARAPSLAGSDPAQPTATAPSEEAVPAPAPQAPADQSVNPSKEFERQTRDPSWAGPTEIEITTRVTKLGARVDTECRHDRCLLSVRGSRDQMIDVLARLEGPAGLQGFAQSIYLTAPIERDGMMAVQAYATFDR